MKIAGIVAEYNPFHNGHKYMIEQVREKGATHIVAVMSGAAVQRGDVAIFDKHYRAETAVKNGVDLVLELPFPYSCATAEIFARSAVEIMTGLGENVVDSIAFGCECDDEALLKKAAAATHELNDSEQVRAELAKGMSYPAAIHKVAAEIYGAEAANILSSPNNTLAVEYIKAAQRVATNVGFIPIKRFNAEHDSEVVSNGFASASLIRNKLYAGDDVSGLLPYDNAGERIYSISRMEREILFRLNCFDKAELLELPDCTDEIADKILSVMADCPKSLDEFLQACKSKNITMARLRRIVMYALIGAKRADMFLSPYIHILAFSSRGAEILAKSKDSKLPIDTSLKALEQSSEKAKRIIQLENRAASFQSACSVGEYAPENEYRRKIQIISD